MNILGHGIDTVDLRRFRILVEDDRYVRDCFTAGEIRSAGTGETRAEKLAGRFAVKEAVLKALGTGIVDGIGLTDIEMLFESGRPAVRLHGNVQKLADSLGVVRWHVSLAHGPDHAIASAIASG